MRSWLLLPLVVVAGCVGRLGGDPADGEVRPDGGAPLDAPGRDTPGADVPGEDTPGADVPSLDAGPTDPCASVTCGAGASCDPATGDCFCAPGFVDVGGSCRAADPGDPVTRTSAEVCAMWAEGHRTTATASWAPGPMECDPGSMSRAALDDTLRRITMFRGLVGLPPVVDEAGRNAIDQACANLMYRNGTIDHFPPMSWRCYSAAGAMGASSSNLAYGTSGAADAIDLFIGDAGVPSLGHRRWVLNDPLGVVGIGFAGNSTCLGVFDSSGSGSRPWTSWPNAGFAPFEGLDGGFGRGVLWSFHSRSMSLGSATVTVTRVSDGAPLAVTVSHPPGGYGPDTVAWQPMGWTPAAGQRYRVTVSAGGTDITYEVELVACG